MKTERLYYKDPYIKNFYAKIIEKDNLNIVLDSTAFYPEGGGQVGDIGTLNDVKVDDTKLLNNQIIHVLEKETELSLDDCVMGRICWSRRYKIMKLHSASHIMEYFLRKHLGDLDRIWSYVDDRKDRSDYKYKSRISGDIIKNIELDTNQFLLKGLDIIHKPSNNDPNILIWKCGPIEMLCGGTHVHNTKEICKVKLKRKNPGKGTERIETSLVSTKYKL